MQSDINLSTSIPLKILLHSPTFSPNIGGVESVSHILAREWSKAGHETTVVTQTAAECERDDIPYKVVRNPSRSDENELVKDHQIIYANSSSPRLLLPAKVFGKPFIWTHANYRLSAIDGLGWDDGHPAPLSPVESIKYHWDAHGPAVAMKGAVRLAALGCAANLVSANVHITHHMAQRHPLPRQHIIYNPYNKALFEAIARPIFRLNNCDTTFTYVGRFVSEKGVHTLLDAFASCIRTSESLARATLKYIGTGPELQMLRERANALGLAEYVFWVCPQNDQELQTEIAGAGICVVPSYFEEPMGIVALELMTAGKPLIVSGTGGLTECAGDACLSFPNGDATSLARVMAELAVDNERQQQLVDAGFGRIRLFDPQLSIEAYLHLFSTLLR